MKKIWTLSFLLMGCLQTENSNSGDAGAYGPASPAFAAAKEVFSSSCVPCHNYQSLSEAQLVAAGLVVPGDAEASEVYYRNIGSSGAGGSKNMPLSGGALSSDDLNAIADWINALTP